ncbi:hypothetical protein NP233_g8718 [Leucocoprinus birnbaumii]|uniref:F-box domain-containing protein n=1 Tax=Leucocoprinus birnbaumii TaxID=56174 RepID=A0AAD5VM09_9AGAR|nr:hypothetical protein NP233_g8718 [Leucocoprinus birnbaumii]
MDQEHRWRPKTPLRPGVFDALPDLVLQRIIQFLSSDMKYLKRFRQTSKRICMLANPCLFAELSINSTALISQSSLGSIEAALRKDRASVLSQHVQKLRVYTVPEEWPNNGHMSVNFDCMNFVVARLQNISTIRWYHMFASYDYPPKSVDDLVQTFGLLPSLRELNLALNKLSDDPVTDLSLEPISNLHVFNLEWLHTRRPHPHMLLQISKLITRSPDIERFSFVIPDATPIEEDFGPSVTLGEILVALDQFPNDLHLRSLETRGVIVNVADIEQHVRHFKSLVDIRIRFDPSPSAVANIGEVLSILSVYMIHLKKIHIDKFYHPDVFTYLSSYPGVEDLSLKPGHHLDDSPEILERFFTSVLPAQAASLRRLRLGVNFDTRWSRPLFTKYLDEVAKCQRLEYICCWVLISLADVDANESGNLLSWLSTALRLPNLRCFKCPPMTLMRRQFNGIQTVAFKPQQYKRNPDPAIRAHLTKLVESFEASARPSFDIDISYTKVI